jgi:hypothetical protein
MSILGVSVALCSRLSTSATDNELLASNGRPFDRAQFETVMQFLLAFITKEKQCDMLLDKLCHRMAMVE